MRLSHLRLSNFRNLAEVELEVPPGVSVYFGQNAQGKTALVEAVYLLAIARSFRAENERELVNFDAARQGGQALVDGTVEDDGVGERIHPHPNPPPQGGGNVGGGEGTLARHRVIIGYRASPSTAASGPGYRVHKEIRVNRMRRTAGSLVGLVHAVLFSVQDIGLVQGPPSARRRFLDILISQADSLYLQGLQRYQRVLQQRNRLLRLRREGRARPDEMEFWDDELVREGAWLTWRAARGDEHTDARLHRPSPRPRSRRLPVLTSQRSIGAVLRSSACSKLVGSVCSVSTSSPITVVPSARLSTATSAGQKCARPRAAIRPSKPATAATPMPTAMALSQIHGAPDLHQPSFLGSAGLESAGKVPPVGGRACWSGGRTVASDGITGCRSVLSAVAEPVRRRY